MGMHGFGYAQKARSRRFEAQNRDRTSLTGDFHGREPPTPSTLHARNRDSESAPRRGCVEHARSAARRARLFARQPAAMGFASRSDGGWYRDGVYPEGNSPSTEN